MDSRYHSDPLRRAISVEACGLVTDDALNALTDRILNDGSFGSEVRLLFDFTHVKNWVISADNLAHLAELPAFSRRSKRAFVVPHGYGTGVLNFYASHALPGTVGVFAARRDAVAWLNEGVEVAHLLIDASERALAAG